MVGRYQAATGLNADGIAGDRTLAALALSEAITTPTPPQTGLLKLGSSGSKVIELQQYLQVLGYYIGPISDYYDRTTQRAVIDFQGDAGLKPDGIVGCLTEAAIESRFNLPPAENPIPISPSHLPDRGDLR